jgi:hypothetical protein
MSSNNNDAGNWTVHLHRHVAFVDVLGYGAVLTSPSFRDEQERADRLLEIWTPLFQVFSDAVEGRDWLYGSLFSDSLYFSAIGPVGLIAIVARLFTGAYFYYEHKGQERSWMPWLRAGIGSGWVMDVRDPVASAAMPPGKSRFTNPTGPGTADAYLRAEKSGVAGMRILVSDQVAAEFRAKADSFRVDDGLVALTVDQLRAAEWPPTVGATGLRDVPWWRCNSNGRVPDRILLDHQWQSEVGENTCGV